MIDLEKGRELFKRAMISSEIHQEEEFELDEHGNFSWIGTDENFDVWLECAKLAHAQQQTIESLKAQLAQYQSDGWISVENRLPKDKQKVFAYRPDAHLKPARDNNLKICEYSSKYEAFLDSIHEVTHWQPLPSSPKGETE